jgi:hypothetical protein
VVVSRLRNPYTPGFGQEPPVLAGRDELLGDLSELLSIAALDGRTPRPAMIVGARGVGKTTLLNRFAGSAGSEHGWPAAHVEVGRDGGFLDELVEALAEVGERLTRGGSRRGVRTTSATVKAQLGVIGGEVRFEREGESVEPRPAALLRKALAVASTVALDLQSGFVITIDEAQLADKNEMNALGKALQHGTRENWPFVAAAAGLPSVREDDKSTSYFERGMWRELGSISYSDALIALQEPARAAGRPMDDDAAALLAEASGGYPYTLQLYGHYAWRLSAGEPRITLAAARASLPEVRRELNDGLYAKRWTIATDAQRQYMLAVAALLAEGVVASGGTVAARLGRTTPQLSRVRQELLTRGFLIADAGELKFTVPGMAQYIRERHDQETDAREAAHLASQSNRTAGAPRADETRSGPQRRAPQRPRDLER